MVGAGSEAGRFHLRNARPLTEDGRSGLAAGTLLFPRPQDSGGPMAFFGEAEGMAHGLGFHQLVEEILVLRGSFEQCALFRRSKFAGAISEQQGLRIETARLIHREGPPTLRSNVRKHRLAIS